MHRYRERIGDSKIHQKVTNQADLHQPQLCNLVEEPLPQEAEQPLLLVVGVAQLAQPAGTRQLLHPPDKQQSADRPKLACLLQSTPGARHGRQGSWSTVSDDQWNQLTLGEAGKIGRPFHGPLGDSLNALPIES